MTNNQLSLPYYETFYDSDAGLRNQAAQLIQEEVAKNGGGLPLPLNITDKPIPSSSVSTGQYDLSPPAIDAPEAVWRSAADLACIRLEYERMRDDNLKVESKLGEIKWKARVATQESLVAQLEATLATTRTQIDQVNKDRQIAHTHLGKQLDLAEAEYMATALKNMAIRHALIELRKRRKTDNHQNAA